MNFESLEDDHPIIKAMMVAEPSKLTEVIAALPAEMREALRLFKALRFSLSS